MTLDLKALVRTIPDYPKKGILFRDITTLIEHPEGFKASIEQIAEGHRHLGVTHVAGIEARGFIFGAGLAIALGVAGGWLAHGRWGGPGGSLEDSRAAIVVH